MFHKMSYALQAIKRQFTIPKSIRTVVDKRLTYLDEPALLELYQAARRIEIENINGIVVECGCALGGSAIVIASAKQKARLLRVHDVFGMIPEPGPEDGVDVQDRYRVIVSGQSDGIGGDVYYGYCQDLHERVIENFAACGYPVRDNNVSLVKGLFQDTLAFNDQIALAHIDGDWFDSVTVCLERIWPALVEGGVIVIDDYDAWSGCRKAVDHFFDGKMDACRFTKKSRLQIVKVASI